MIIQMKGRWRCSKKSRSIRWDCNFNTDRLRYFKLIVLSTSHTQNMPNHTQINLIRSSQEPFPSRDALWRPSITVLAADFEKGRYKMASQELMKSSDAARSLLLARPWWNLCFVHGDQTKYYRQLYGKRRAIRTLAESTCQCNPDGQSTLQRKQ